MKQDTAFTLAQQSLLAPHALREPLDVPKGVVFRFDSWGP